MIDRTLTVLLIEDNPGDVLLVEEMLRSTGEHRIELRVVNRIQNARLLMSQQKFDALLLDLSLPDIHGLDTLEKIHEFSPDYPIVVLSSLQDEEMAVLALQLGAQDFLVKGTINGHLLTRSLFYAIKRKELDNHLLYIANHDPLTGLYNRKYFYERLNAAIQTSGHQRTGFAVLLIDCVNFRAVNDTFGQSVGDQLLKEVGEELQRISQAPNIVARLGGDEFGLILDHVSDQMISEVAQSIHDTISQIHLIDSNEIDLSLSIGISRFPTDGKNSGELIRTAGRALKYSRESSDIPFHYYSPNMDQDIRSRQDIRSKFSGALKNDELLLHYQPIVNIRTNTLIGVEALVRWQHPEKGLLKPGSFLPDIMGTELIVMMGEWVLNQALSRLSDWHSLGMDLMMSVNVDLLQLRKPDFIFRLEQILSRYPNVPRSKLELEILEYSTPEGFPNLPEVLSDIHCMGIRLAIDDFGTGYSSLAYLKQLPVDALKIDQGFVIGMRNNRENLALIESIVSLGRIFGRGVIAEGMEEGEYIPLLLKLGCEQAQGYAIARPMPEEKFLEWQYQWNRSDPSESFPSRFSINELSILSAQVRHFSWLQRILFLAQKGVKIALTPSEEAEFLEASVQDWYLHDGKSDYGEIQSFKDLDHLQKESLELAKEMLQYIREKNLDGVHYDTHRILLSKDSLLSLYGTLQKDAVFLSIMDKKTINDPTNEES